MAEARSKKEKEKKGGFFREKGSQKKEKETGTSFSVSPSSSTSQPEPRSPSPTGRPWLKGIGRSHSFGSHSSKAEKQKSIKHVEIPETSSGSQAHPTAPAGVGLCPQPDILPRNHAGEVPTKELKHKREAEMYSEQLIQSQEECQKIFHQLNQQKKENEQLQNVLTELEEQKKVTEEELRKKEEECQRISHDLEVQREQTEKEVAERERKGRELAEKVQTMTETHEATCQQIQCVCEAKLHEARQELQSTIVKKDEEHKKFQEHKQTMEKEMEEKMTKLKEHHKEQVEGLKERMQQIEREKEKEVEAQKVLLQKQEWILTELKQKHEKEVLQANQERDRLQREAKHIEQIQRERDVHIQEIGRLQEEKHAMIQQQENKEATWRIQESLLQTQLEAMKKEHETKVTELLATHQQALDSKNGEVQRLEALNKERLVQLEQQQSSEMERKEAAWQNEKILLQTQHEQAVEEVKEQYKAKLADLVASHQQEMEQIRHEVDRLKAMNLEKGTKLQQLEQQQSLEMEREEGDGQSGEAAAEVASLRKKLQEKDQEIHNLRAQVSSVEPALHEKEELMRQREKLTREKKNLVDHSKKESQAVRDLEQKLEQGEAKQYAPQQQALEAEIEHLKEELQTEKASRVTATLQAESSKLKLEQLLQQMQHVQSQLKTSVEQVQELSKQLHDAKEKYAKMESNYQAVTAQADHCHSLTEQVTVLKEKATQLRSRYAKLEEESQGLKLKAEQYERDFQEERRDKEKAVQCFDDERAKNAVDIQVAKDEIARLTEETRQKDELLLMAQRELDKKSREVANLQKDVEVKTAQMKQYKKQIDNLPQRLNTGQQQQKHATKFPPELSSFRIKAVKGLNEKDKKGSGAYGVVYHVTVDGVPCISKHIHAILQDDQVPQQDKVAARQKFAAECILLSQLQHPNIVHFIGVHYRRGLSDLSLLMECLEMNLGHCLDTRPNIPLSIKLSILQDVAYGLLYLHTHNPPIIHRDLSANNVLLTKHMTAKIADLGVSKLLDNCKYANTKAPGALYYMPPEALQPKPSYDYKLDNFSFGHLCLYVATQQFPEIHEVEITRSALRNKTVQILKRREAFKGMGTEHPLHNVALCCLQDSSEKRPTTSQLQRMMHQLCTKYPKETFKAHVQEPIKESNDVLHSENVQEEYLVLETKTEVEYDADEHGGVWYEDDDGHDESWSGGGGDGGGRDESGEGRDRCGEGELTKSAQLGAGQQREQNEKPLRELSSFPSVSAFQGAAYKQQLSTKSPEHIRQQQEKQDYVVHVANDPVEEMGTKNPVTGVQVPRMTCIVCGQMFQQEEIQLYHKHIESCEK